MKGTARLPWLLLPLLLLLVGGGEGGREGNLYSMLGVSRKANQREIRSAYKRLAREWHPDKNKSPRAQEKIMEINKAYEVLSDEESRRLYDMTGETDPAPQGSRGHPHNHGFTVFQTGGGHFQFHFGGGGFGHAPQRRDTITSHYFQTTVLSESEKKLFLLNFFSDFCMQCGEVATIWDELREEMESNDVGMGSVHALHHQDIARHCGVDRVPAIVAIVNKRAFHYHGHLQIRSIRKFVKDSIPKWVIAELNFKNVDNFISDSIKQNKPRVLLFSPHPQPSLLYKSTAFSNKNSADFAYLSTDRRSGNSLDFLKRFGASWTVKRLLVYKEYPTPSAEIEESELTGDALRSVVQGLRLHLPRLSSTRAMESVCENEGEGRVCLVLVVRGVDTYNDSITAAFRELAVSVSSDNRAPALSMAYIDEEKQEQFVGAFGGLGTLRSCAGGGKARPILLLKRKAGLYASYDWFSEFCGSEGDGKNLLSFAATTTLQYTTMLPDQKDEFAPGVLGQLWNRVETGWHAIHDYFTNSDSQMLSLLTMMVAMAAMMCCLSLIGANQNTEEEERRKQSSGKPVRRKGRRQSHGGETGADISPIVPLLDKELYQRHVEHAHKALVTVVLLYDVAEDLSIFSEAAKNHKSRQFKYFHTVFETQQPWLHDLLAVCNMESTEKEKRNEMYFGEGSVCILALFGARKQFVIFPESVNMSHTPDFRNRHIVKTKKESTASGDLVDTVLNTFGFDDKDSSDTAEHCNHRESKSDDFQMKNQKNYQRDDTTEVVGSSSKLSGEEGKHLQGASSKPPSQTEEDIDTGSNDTGLYTGDERTTDGWSEALYVWLERLEDGSLRRYSVDHWPEWQGN